MKPFRILLSALGCFALLAVTSSAQDENPDKTTQTPPPPMKGGVESSDDTFDTARGDQPSAVNSDDQATKDSSEFKKMDTDGDNRISRSEFMLAPKMTLRAGSGVDATPASDGQQSQGLNASGTTDSSLSSGHGDNPSELFDEIDTDKDGFVSQAELAVHHSNENLPK